MNALIIIINFTITCLAFVGGLWLGLRLQKPVVKQDIRKIAGKFQSLKKKPLKKVDEPSIIKALTPDQVEAEKKRQFEKDNY